MVLGSELLPGWRLSASLRLVDLLLYCRLLVVIVGVSYWRRTWFVFFVEFVVVAAIVC